MPGEAVIGPKGQKVISGGKGAQTPTWPGPLTVENSKSIGPAGPVEKPLEAKRNTPEGQKMTG